MKSRFFRNQKLKLIISKRRKILPDMKCWRRLIQTTCERVKAKTAEGLKTREEETEERGQKTRGILPSHRGSCLAGSRLLGSSTAHEYVLGEIYNFTIFFFLGRPKLFFTGISEKQLFFSDVFLPYQDEFIDDQFILDFCFLWQTGSMGEGGLFVSVKKRINWLKWFHMIKSWKSIKSFIIIHSSFWTLNVP